MIQRIKRMYYQWVIRNCQRDINELRAYLRENMNWLSPFDVCSVRSDINELTKVIDNARAKL